MKFKKIITVLLCISMLAGIMACGSKNEVGNAFTKKADSFLASAASFKITDEMRVGFRAGFMMAIQSNPAFAEYGSDPSMQALLEYFQSDDFLNEMIDTVKGYLSVFKYTVGDAKVTGDNAVLVVHLTRPDLMSSVLALAVDPNFSALTGVDQPTPDQLKQLMTTILSTLKKPTTVNVDISVNMVKVDGEWKIVIDEVVFNALGGGVMDLLQSTMGEAYVTQMLQSFPTGLTY